MRQGTSHLEAFVLKLLNMFCIPMLLQIKLDRGLLMSVRVLKAENCLAYYVFETVVESESRVPMHPYDVFF